MLSTLLKKPQEDAEKLYNSKQLLISARILNYQDGFDILDSSGTFEMAKFDDEKQLLEKSDQFVKAKDDQILTLYSNRVEARLTNKDGEILTFEEAGVNEQEYMAKNEKLGYANLEYKLLYVILPNLPENEINENTPVYGYVIPIAGYGLWDAIYGYLCLEANADTIIGTTWYNQKETPGLGGEIGTAEWQKQFYGKRIFLENADGTTNFQRSLLGIKVVKTTVKEELGNTPASKSAVDGIAGASITIAGVTEAYRQTLGPYRPFLIKAHNKYLNQTNKGK
ncbi:MAG: Na(+)-translocating NADH-quinone reductase subunit C [Chlamydiia bacterium]|nr:Na(+)-translocating NADH-quinone reductase subunit C [Chlamydiia bacterium]